MSKPKIDSTKRSDAMTAASYGRNAMTQFGAFHVAQMVWRFANMPRATKPEPPKSQWSIPRELEAVAGMVLHKVEAAVLRGNPKPLQNLLKVCLAVHKRGTGGNSVEPVREFMLEAINPEQVVREFAEYKVLVAKKTMRFKPAKEIQAIVKKPAGKKMKNDAYTLRQINNVARETGYPLPPHKPAKPGPPKGSKPNRTVMNKTCGRGYDPTVRLK